DNIDNDDNGIVIGTVAGVSIASLPITLAYNTEPTNGTGNDTNNTLDFGFSSDVPPVGDLDTATGTNDFATTFTEDTAHALIAGTVSIVDPDDTLMESATIDLSNAKSGDVLTYTGVVAGINLDPASTATHIILTGSASKANYATAIQSITF